jgi:hypothetical protein
MLAGSEIPVWCVRYWIMFTECARNGPKHARYALHECGWYTELPVLSLISE